MLNHSTTESSRIPQSNISSTIVSFLKSHNKIKSELQIKMVNIRSYGLHFKLIKVFIKKTFHNFFTFAYIPYCGNDFVMAETGCDCSASSY